MLYCFHNKDYINRIAARSDERGTNGYTEPSVFTLFFIYFDIHIMEKGGLDYGKAAV